MLQSILPKAAAGHISAEKRPEAKRFSSSRETLFGTGLSSTHTRTSLALCVCLCTCACVRCRSHHRIFPLHVCVCVRLCAVRWSVAKRKEERKRRLLGCVRGGLCVVEFLFVCLFVGLFEKALFDGKTHTHIPGSHQTNRGRERE